MSNRPLVYLRGTGQHATHSMSAGWPGETLAEWPHLKKAGEVAFKNAQLTPKDIDVAQTHDCFTISEIIELEELGFCKKGEGGAFVASGAIGLDGTIPTNTDGGLLVYGHPFGASGATPGAGNLQAAAGAGDSPGKERQVRANPQLKRHLRPAYRGHLRQRAG